MTITSRNEQPVFIEAGGEDLFGILTAPEGQGNGVAVLSLWGAGGFPSFGKNQLRIRLAHQLADRGFHVLRVDYRGIGESGGEPRPVVDMSQPWAIDCIGPVRWLQARGFERIVILGVCFGARSALAAAERISGLAGLGLVAPPVGHAQHRDAVLQQPMTTLLKRAASPATLRMLVGGGKAKRRRQALRQKLWRMVRPPKGASHHDQGDLSPLFLEPLRAALDGGVPTLLFYGRSDDFYLGFERARTGELGTVLDAAGPLATVRIVDSQMGGMPSVEAQDAFLDVVLEWIDTLPGVAAAHTATRRAGNGL